MQTVAPAGIWLSGQTPAPKHAPLAAAEVVSKFVTEPMTLNHPEKPGNRVIDARLRFVVGKLHIAENV